MSIPQEVLGDALAAAIGGRRVRTAVFTTFSFDPGFFELHILPLLFDYPFSQVEKVKRIQLEDQLPSTDVAVYYDRSALAQDALPAQLDFRRIDVRRRGGVFHSKLVLLLVGNPPEWEDEEEPGLQSLVVGTLSANLTRAGWWENVETGHFEEIPDLELSDRPCPFRQDLLKLIGRLKATSAPDEDHAALDEIHAFIRNSTSTQTVTNHSVGGRYRTRLFMGQEGLADWLSELNLGRREWNLEVISPFFDHGHASTLKALIEAIDPREARIYLPTKPDGTAEVAKDTYEAIEALAHWAKLPAPVTRAGTQARDQKALPRHVHAKIYRFWNGTGNQVVLTGSVNLTAAGHSHAGAGNLEAAFLVDVSDEGIPRRWWLDRIDYEPETYTDKPAAETDESREVCVDISFRYDWSSGVLQYRIDGPADSPLRVQEPSGRDLFRIERPGGDKWIACEPSATNAVRALLASTSFLLVRSGDTSWRVLVREEGMAHRPSLLTTLTPEEILMYWSLLSPAQRAAFVEERLAAESKLEGLQVSGGTRYSAKDTVFDRFAGLYHAFEQLYKQVGDSIEDGREKEAEVRLFGAKYDSLPALLEKWQERNDGDPVMRYVTFLCARQLRDRVKAEFPEFWKTNLAQAHRLEGLLATIPKHRQHIELDSGANEFLNWYEKSFLREIEQPQVLT